jgi:hypothetical protein
MAKGHPKRCTVCNHREIAAFERGQWNRVGACKMHGDCFDEVLGLLEKGLGCTVA